MSQLTTDPLAAASSGDEHSRQDVLDILVTEEDVCFVRWPTVATVRSTLEARGFGHGTPTALSGRSYECPGGPLAGGVGTSVTHTTPR